MIKNVLIHLRIPFSVFLLPVYLFALSQAGTVHRAHAWWAFVLIHLFLYPASNAYNSYYDKDEGSIGLLKTPPPVTRELWIAAWSLDIAAVLIALLAGLGWFFVGYLVVYGLISKAYSHPLIRLKKRPVLSLVIVGIFQGFITYLATWQVITGQPAASLFQWQVLLPAAITTTNLLAVYPLTQVYQHEEDARHGDLTYSRLVGIRGTFLNAALFFNISFAGFIAYFLLQDKPLHLALLAAMMAPALGFFGWWFKSVSANASAANFTNTMYMNALASLCLNLFFGVLCLLA